MQSIYPHGECATLPRRNSPEKSEHLVWSYRHNRFEKNQKLSFGINPAPPATILLRHVSFLQKIRLGNHFSWYCVLSRRQHSFGPSISILDGFQFLLDRVLSLFPNRAFHVFLLGLWVPAGHRENVPKMLKCYAYFRWSPERYVRSDIIFPWVSIPRYLFFCCPYRPFFHPYIASCNN